MYKNPGTTCVFVCDIEKYYFFFFSEHTEINPTLGGLVLYVYEGEYYMMDTMVILLTWKMYIIWLKSIQEFHEMGSPKIQIFPWYKIFNQYFILYCANDDK